MRIIAAGRSPWSHIVIAPPPSVSHAPGWAVGDCPLRAGAGGPLRAAPDQLDIGRGMLGRHDTRWAVARHAPPTRGRFRRRDARRFYHRVWSTAPRCNWAEQRKSATRRAVVDPRAACANSCSAQAPTSRGPVSAARAPGSLLMGSSPGLTGRRGPQAQWYGVRARFWKFAHTPGRRFGSRPSETPNAANSGSSSVSLI